MRKLVDFCGATRRLLSVLFIGTLCQLPADAMADASTKKGGQWWAGYHTGVMTDGRAHEMFIPNDVELVDAYLAGVIVGYERQIGDSRFSYGAEFQANAHFGQDGFYEIAIPAVLRYHPEKSWWDAFDSFAFALGGSHYSEISALEKEIYGESRRNLFYWYIETEFKTRDPKSSLFARIHHRSNAWDAVEPNGGSNAFVLGFRKKF